MNALLKLQTRLESQGYQVSLHVLAPGTVFGPHCALESRFAWVFSGQLGLVIGSDAVLLGPGEWAEIPAGATLSAEVLGDEPVLGFDARECSGAGHRASRGR